MLTALPRHKFFPTFHRLITGFLSEGDVTCVQIGANDGLLEDPLYEFTHRPEFRALLVEPHPRYYRELVGLHADRPNITLANVAVGLKSGWADLHYVDYQEGMWPCIKGVASFNPDYVLKHADKVPDMATWLRRISVPTLTFSELLQRYHLAMPDVVVLDVEGLDGALVQAVLVAGQLPRMILFEHEHLSLAEYTRCRAALEAAGYRLEATKDDTLAYR